MNKQAGRKFISDLKSYSDFLGWNEKENRYETWNEAVDDIFDSTFAVKYADKWDELKPYTDFARQMVKDKKCLTAMRHLQFRGDDIFKHEFRGYNCLGHETEFITDKGVKSFDDFKHGDETMVWTHQGRWRKAVVKNYGKQTLNEITFKYHKTRQIVRATSNHRWFLQNGQVTDSLKEGDRILKPKEIFTFDYDKATPFEKLYWCYGYVFGDGTRTRDELGNFRYSMVRLCGDQIKFAYRFEEMGFHSSSSLSIHGDLIFYTGKYLKTMPDIDKDSLNLIQGFMCGYLDADGSKNNNTWGKIYNSIQTSDENNVAFLRSLLPTCGFFIYKEIDNTGEITNFGTRPYTIDFSITNNLGSKYNVGYTVESILEDQEEEVWCLEVEDDQSFTLKNGIVTGNCLVMYADKPSFLGNAFYLSLCGCGVGVNMMLPFIDRLPWLHRRHKGTKTFVIQDNIEGWTDGFHALISSYIDESSDAIEGFEEYQGYAIKFDYSLIRAKGAKVGRRFLAPGPDGLRNSFQKIEELLDNYLRNDMIGNKFTTVIAYDIFMHLMNAVLSGGVRRSAASVIFSPEDKDMLECKADPLWRTNNLQRERSNNSVGLVKGTFTKEQFEEILKLNKDGNDVGFVFMNHIFEIYNPCFEIGFTPLYFNFLSGTVREETIQRIQESDISVLDDGVKTAIQCCNLTEGNLATCKTPQDFYDICRAQGIIGSMQAGFLNFKHIKDCLFETIEISKQEALLGVSFAGFANAPWILERPDVLSTGAAIVLGANKEIADIIGTSYCARATCVKPGGDGPIVLMEKTPCEPGATEAHSKRLFRVMQLNKDTDTAKYLQEHMPYLLEESTHSENHTDHVVFVPIENEEGTIYKDDMRGVKHLKNIKIIMENWVNPGKVESRCIIPTTSHNVSNTVVVGEEDYKEVTDYIFENQDIFRAVSFAAPALDKDYNQCPNTSVLTGEEILAKYGEASMFASGLVVDALHAFDDNLWDACTACSSKDFKLTGNRVTVLIKKDIVRRFKQFAKNYFKNDINEMLYCLKDVHLYHKWRTITRQMKEVDFTEILTKPQYIEIDTIGAKACNGSSCSI